MLLACVRPRRSSGTWVRCRVPEDGVSGVNIPSSAGGGAADKLGNRYEGLWTVYSGVVPVLKGQASALVVEALGQLGEGIEFRLTRRGCDEVHQAKRQRAGSSWTVNALSGRRCSAPSAGTLASRAPKPCSCPGPRRDTSSR